MSERNGRFETSSSVGDRIPKVEQLPDGRRKISVRVQRPRVDIIKSLGKAEVKARVREFQQANVGGLSDVDVVDAQAIYGSRIDYKNLMGTILPVEPTNMEFVGEPLEMIFVRHEVHEHNTVSAKTVESYKTRVDEMIRHMNISSNDIVYVVASPSGEFVGTNPDTFIKKSRTEATADIIKDVLKTRGISFVGHIDTEEDAEGRPTGSKGSVDSALTTAFQEFEIYDMEAFKGATNKARDKRGRNPAVQASFAPDVLSLIKETGIAEVSSATVARALKGVDKLEAYFLNDAVGNQPGKRKVVIVVGHGQWTTNITEAMNEATNNKVPIIYSRNGDYFSIEARRTERGDIIEDYSFFSEA